MHEMIKNVFAIKRHVLPSLFLYALFEHEDDGIRKNRSTILHR